MTIRHAFEHSARGLLGAWTALQLVACSPSPEASRDDALRFLAEQATAPDVSWSYLAPYLARTYGTEIHLASGHRFVPDGPPDGLELPLVYRRLVDARSSISREDIASLDSPVDRLLVTALHCDRLGLPNDWIGTLRATGDRGGYALTHAVLAAGWTLENGCLSTADLGPLRERQLGQLEILMESRDELADRDRRASDIWIEGLALFGYSGAPHRVRADWLEALQALQRPDGGWPEHPRAERSSPHTTAFALWALFEALEPASGARDMLLR